MKALKLEKPKLQGSASQREFLEHLETVKREHRLSSTTTPASLAGKRSVTRVSSTEINTTGVRTVQRNSVGEEAEINGYKVIRNLGSGSFATVKLVEKNNVRFAMKCFNKSILKRKRDFKKENGKMKMSNAMDKVMDEIAVMKKLRHPNIVQLYDVIDDEEEDKLFVVMELVTCGEVMEYDPKKGRFVSNRRLSYLVNNVQKKHASLTGRVLTGLGAKKDRHTIDMLQDAGLEATPRTESTRSVNRNSTWVLKESTARRYMVDCIQGLHYIHTQGVCHRLDAT